MIPAIGETEKDFRKSKIWGPILDTLQALGTQDERIHADFLAISTGGPSAGKIVEIDLDEKIGIKLSDKRFKKWLGGISNREYKRGRVLWIKPYDEAIKTIQELKKKGMKLDSSSDYFKAVKSGKLDGYGLPSSPSWSYRNGI